MKAEKKGPLEGIKVLDLSAVFPGPLAAMHLGDLGAKVIKVEHPKIGDWGRKLGPAFKPKSGHGQRVMDSGMFYMCNRNKHSITVNIMKKEGRKIIHQLLPAVDIIIESNKPGILHKLGLDYETLKHNYPQLIYCHISMFGYKGPYSTKMGHDGNCLAYSGLLNLNLNNKGKPVLPGYQIADTGGSYIGLSSILAALYYREKHKTGQFIDVSLLDCSFSFQSIPLGFYQSGEQQIGGKTALSGNLPNYNI